jgi:hypothetical protein
MPLFTSTATTNTFVKFKAEHKLSGDVVSPGYVFRVMCRRVVGKSRSAGLRKVLSLGLHLPFTTTATASISTSSPSLLVFEPLILSSVKMM